MLFGISSLAHGSGIAAATNAKITILIPIKKTKSRVSSGHKQKQILKYENLLVMT